MTRRSRLGRAPLRRAGALLGAAALSSLSALGGCSAPPGPVAPKPNVLILVVDALRADHLGFAGYPRPTSPRLDALARESVWFRDAHAQATWTRPSIGSLLTSRFPSELGLLDLDTLRDARSTQDLGPNWPYLPERFQAAGWRTGASVNQVHLSPKRGFARGFDSYRHSRGRDAYQINQRIEPFLDDGAPFFAYVHYLDVHWPYDRALPGRDDEFGPREFVEAPPRRGLDQIRQWEEHHLDSQSLEILRNRYDAEVRLADHAAGLLFDGLRRRNLWENTIVVVTADHGEGFLEHGEIMHGYSPYNEVSRVPLLIRLPARFGVAPGPRESSVGLVDLAPTLADLAGLAADPGQRGRSLKGILEGREELNATTLVQSEKAWALRDRGHSVLAFVDGTWERYDLDTDPAETRSLTAAECGPPCRHLETRLRRYVALIGPSQAQAGSQPLTDEEIEELKALGYL